MRAAGALGIVTLLVLLSACSVAAGPSASASPPSNALHGSVIAGPTCPVERPGDSACAPRVVSGATIIVQLGSGSEVARTTTGADGTFSVALAPGTYRLVPQPVSGLMGTAQPLTVTLLAAGVTEPAPLVIRYDTGIR